MNIHDDRDTQLKVIQDLAECERVVQFSTTFAAVCYATRERLRAVGFDEEESMRLLAALAPAIQIRVGD